MLELARKSSYLLTGIAVLFALALTFGRITLLFPESVETFLNQKLAASDVKIQGMDSGWRVTNPIFHIKHLEFPQGVAHEIDIELAMIESLFRQQLVARRLVVKNVDLTLAPAAREQEFDFFQLIEQVQTNFEWVQHTDELIVAGTIALHNQRGTQVWQANVRAVNQGGTHLYRADLSSPNTPQTGDLTFRADAVDTLFDIRQGDYQMTLHTSALPLDLSQFTGSTGLPQLNLTSSAAWERRSGLVSGRAQVELGEQDEAQLYANLGIVFRKTNDQPMRFRVESPTLRTSDYEAVLSDWFVAFDTDRLFGTTQNLHLQELTPAAITLLRDDESTVAWLTQVGVRTTLNRLEFFFDASGLHWFADMKDTFMNSHNQQPEIQVSKNEAYGNLNQFAFELKNATSRLLLEAHFNHRWHFADASGLVVLDARGSNFGLLMHELKLTTNPRETDSDFEAQLHVPSLTRLHSSQTRLNDLIREPVIAELQGGMYHIFGGDPNYRIALAIASEASLLPAHQMLEFVPKQLVEDIAKWRDEYVEDASFYDTNVLYMTYRDLSVTTNQRDVHVHGGFTDGSVTYKPDWPILSGVSGTWHADNNGLTVRANRATINDAEVNHGVALFPWDASESFEVSFATIANTQQLLDFVQASEIKDWLPAIHSSWQGDGLISMDVRLKFPYTEVEDSDEQSSEIAGEHQIDFKFDDVSLNMLDISLEWRELSGQVTWHSPYNVEGTFDGGLLFDQPAIGEIRTSIVDDHDHDYDHLDIAFHVDTSMSVKHASIVADIAEYHIGHGVARADATMRFFPGTNEPATLFVTTDLVGVELDLPAPLAKPADESIESTLHLTFHDERIDLNLQSRELNSWLRFTGDPATIQSGAVAIGQATPVPNRIPDQLNVTGLINEWEFEFSDTETLEVPVALNNFRINRLRALEQDFNNVIVNGTYDAETHNVAIESDIFSGAITKQLGDSHTRIDAKSLQWFIEAGEDDVDPLDVGMIDDLIPAEVHIEELWLEFEDEPIHSWGSWNFKLTPDAQGVEIADLSASMFGLNIEAAEPMRWNQKTNESTFKGTLSGNDTAAFFKAWDIDSNVESQEFDVNADIQWGGSPLALEIENVNGAIQANARDGRFINVDQGGDVLRLVSLMNFSKILNRLTLDFKDVTQSGLHYDEAAVDLAINDGVISFVDPLRIEGPSVRLSLDGLVDMRADKLDATMSVRIPLHKGLQTYAAYLAATNPPATVGLLLGTLLISEPIKELLTANYNITGSLDSTEITRVGFSASQTAAN